MPYILDDAGSSLIRHFGKQQLAVLRRPRDGWTNPASTGYLGWEWGAVG